MSCAGAQPLFMTRMVLETRAAPMAAGAHVSTWRGVGLGLGLTLSLTLTLTLNSNPNPKTNPHPHANPKTKTGRDPNHVRTDSAPREVRPTVASCSRIGSPVTPRLMGSCAGGRPG